MKTQTIIIGQTVENQPLKNVIRFEKYLNSFGYDFTIGEANTTKPKDYNFIELICKNYTNDCDLMFAYNNPNRREEGTLFIGKWNDGVVE